MGCDNIRCTWTHGWCCTTHGGWGGVGCDNIRCHLNTLLMLRNTWGLGWGGIGSYWTLMKAGASQTQGQKNRVLWMCIKSHERRWEQTGKDLFSVTGKTVARLWRGTEEQEARGASKPHELVSHRFWAQNIVRVNKQPQKRKNLSSQIYITIKMHVSP